MCFSLLWFSLCHKSWSGKSNNCCENLIIFLTSAYRVPPKQPVVTIINNYVVLFIYFHLIYHRSKILEDKKYAEDSMVVHTGVIFLHRKKVKCSSKYVENYAILVGVGHKHVDLSFPPLPLLLLLMGLVDITKLFCHLF